VVGMDCAAVNERAFDELRARIEPHPGPGQIRFTLGDLSQGLTQWRDGSIDGVVSRVGIQYSEYYSPEHPCWTTDAYYHLLAEVYRVLREGGRFIFSVNVPEPSWGRVALHSLTGVFRARRPSRYLKNALRMMRYGSWLKREARRGRFHYLPIEVLKAKLSATG